MARIRPYLCRATYDWIVEHNFTPFCLVDAEQDNVEVPLDYVEDGQILMNLSPQAVQDLEIRDEFLSFNASFSGEAMHVFVPVNAILALYANESGQGIFAREDDFGMLVIEGQTEEELDPASTKGPLGGGKKGPGLRIVK